MYIIYACEFVFTYIYEGYSKGCKTNSKKYFSYEIYKINFSTVSIQFITLLYKRCFHRKIPGLNFSMEISLTEVL